MIATEPNTHDERPMQDGLCPACHGSVLTISGSVAVHFVVRLDAADREVAVMHESISADGWDAASEAACMQCGWLGTAGDVGPLRAQ